MNLIRKHVAGLALAGLLATPFTARAADRKQAQGLQRPGHWSVAKLEPDTRARHAQIVERKRKVSVPLIVSGLAMVGAGIGMMAASPQKMPNQYLREGGSIPCQANTYINGSLTSSRSTSCRNETVYEHSDAYRGGVALVVSGGLFTVFGLVKK